MIKGIRRAAIYARVSTDGQTTANQLQELRTTAERNGWDVVEEFVDHGISGAKGRDKRPRLDALWKGVGRKDFDVVMVWAVDRIGRSLQHLIAFLEELQSKRIDLFIHQQGIDTATPAGKAMFQMLGVFSEFERSIIRERVKSGIKRIRANNPDKGWGRRKLEESRPEVAARIVELRKQGLGMVAIAKIVGVSSRTVQVLLQRPSEDHSSATKDETVKMDERCIEAV
ncbi:MAG: recombinase family protein [Nitrospira sp.]|nr:recombinase family protein [Nitrospira sp.]